MATQLEELYVQMDVKGHETFVKNMNACKAAIDRTDKAMQRFAGNSQQYASQAQIIADSVKNLGASLSKVTAEKIDTITQSFKGLFKAMGNLGTLGSEPINQLLALTSWAQGFKGLPIARIETFSENLKLLTRSMTNMTKLDLRSINPKMQAIIKWITDLAVVPTAGISVIGKFNKAMDSLSSNAPTYSVRLQAVTRSIQDLTSTFTKAASARMTGLATVLGGLSVELQKIGSLGTLPVSQLSALTSWAQGFKGLPLARMATFAANMTQMINAMNALTAVNVKAVSSNTAALIGWVNQLTSISPAALTTLSRMGRAFGSISAFMQQNQGANAPIATVANNFNLIPPAANRASTSIGRVSTNLNALYARSLLAGNALSILRYGFLGLGAFGIAAFVRMDDALTRIMARMRLFPGMENFGPTRKFLEGGISDLASRVTTSRSGLTSGLQFLTDRHGPVMGMKELAIAESFAAASGMDMVEASKKVIDVFTQSGDRVTHLTGELDKMRYITDLITGSSLMAGGSTKQFSEMLDVRFLSIIRQANINLETGVALLGAYSRLGEQFRGTAGGEIATRAIMALDASFSQHSAAWEMLGLKFQDKKGQRLPFSELIGNAEALFRSKGLQGEAGTAELRRMGLELRNARAVIPLLQGGGTAMKEFLEQMKSMGGITEKVAEMMRRSFLGQLKILWNNATNAAIAVGDNLAPALHYLTTALTAATRWFTNLNPAIQNLIVLSAAATYGLKPLVGTLLHVGSYLAAPFLAVGEIIYSVMAGIGKTIWMLVTGPIKFFHDVTWDAFTSLKKFIFGLPTLFMSMLTWIPAIILGVATIGTLLAGLPAVLSLISSGWDHLVVNADQFAESAVAGLHSIGNTAISMWDAARPHMINFFSLIKEWIKSTAGFFWNFAENIDRIFKWLAENETTIISDMLRMMDVGVKNTIENFKRLGTLIVDSINPIGVAIWTTLTEGFSRVFGWLKAQWPNILGDMTKILGTFTANWLINVGDVATRIPIYAAKQLASNMRIEDSIALDDKTRENRRKLVASGASKAELTIFDLSARKFHEEQREKRREEREKQDRNFAELYGNLRSPFQGMPKLFTDFSGFGAGLSGFGASTRFNFSSAFEKAGDVLSSFKWFVPLLQGFVPKTPALGLNTAMPEDWLKKLVDTFRRQTTGAFAEPQEEIGSLVGHGKGTGEFRQISLARTMLGGPAAESIEHAQLTQLEMMNKSLSELLTVFRAFERTGVIKTSSTDIKREAAVQAAISASLSFVGW